MSTTTTAPVPQPAAQPKVVLGTVYDFSNHKKSVEISYSTDRKGPPPTEFIVAATLTYNGPALPLATIATWRSSPRIW
jgi:hypothetical protein